MSVCEAFLKKWNWEPANRLTTIDKVEQLDDDRVVIYRRYDAFNAPFTSWEQIVLNRSNQSIEADVVGPNPNGTTYSVEKTVLTPSAQAAQSVMDTYVYDCQGMGTSKIEIFKNQVIQLQKVLKFNQWAAEE